MKDIYQIVTDKIIDQLEKGTIPWRKPWTGTPDGAFNRISKKPYSLLNQMLLSHTGEYATLKQWNDLGGRIKKGSKSEMVVFWKIQQTETENENGEKDIKKIPLLRYYNVFHISQVDGVKPLETSIEKPMEPIANAEMIRNDYQSRERLEIIETVSDKAFYSPSRDMIKIPCKSQYNDITEFYSTLFHEMVHSTGHHTRLDRLTTGANARFGSDTYSKEELVAEMGSAFILSTLGIDTEKTFTNSTAYIQNWLQVLRNDNRFIISASSKAEKAVNYIFNK